MSLLRLSDDLLLDIYLSYLDVQDVINIDKLCRRLRCSTNSRLLWLSFLHQLDLDHAPDLPDNIDIDSLDTHPIRRLVIRAHRAFRKWNALNGPCYYFDAIFTDVRLNYIPDMGRIKQVKILSTADGGRYFLAYRQSGLFQLWNILTGASIARFCPFPQDSRLLLPPDRQHYQFALSVSEDDAAARLFVVTQCLESPRKDDSTSIDDLPLANHIIVADINLTGTKRKLTQYFKDIFSHEHISQPTLNGDFLAFLTPTAFVVYHWRNKKRVSISLPEYPQRDPETCRIWLMRGHLIVARDRSRETVLTPINLNLLFNEDFKSKQVRWREIPREGVYLDGTRTLVSVVYTNWKPESERAIYVRTLSVKEDSLAKVCVYQLTIDQQSERKISRLELISDNQEVTTRVTGRLIPSQISNAGRVMFIPDVDRMYAVPDFIPISILWTSSLWALSKQRNYDRDDGANFDTRIMGMPGSSRSSRSVPLQIPLDTNIHTTDDFYMLLDPQSSAIHTRTTSHDGAVCVYYL